MEARFSRMTPPLLLRFLSSVLNFYLWVKVSFCESLRVFASLCKSLRVSASLSKQVFVSFCRNSNKLMELGTLIIFSQKSILIVDEKNVLIMPIFWKEWLDLGIFFYEGAADTKYWKKWSQRGADERHQDVYSTANCSATCQGIVRPCHSKVFRTLASQ